MTVESAQPNDLQTARAGIAAQGVERSLSALPHLEPEPAPAVVRGLPADEQGTDAQYVPASSTPMLLFLLGTLLLAVSAACWVLPESFEGWCATLPIAGFIISLFGFVAFYSAMVAYLSEPERPSANQFVAWGRLGTGVALTIIGAVAARLVSNQTWAPDEAKVFSTLVMISGPVLCGWAAYGTFVKDPAQRNTGWLMIATAGAVLAILLSWQ
jgi:hypothetical protein